MSPHVLDAQDSNYDDNLNITPPRDPNKVIPGTWDTAPLTRDNSTASAARTEMRKVCKARDDYQRSATLPSLTGSTVLVTSERLAAHKPPTITHATPPLTSGSHR